MCGIAALVDAPSTGVGPRVAAATAEVRHRGPDETHVWLDEGRAVALGHARLSIIDAATGRQPLSNEDGTIRAAVNGEFYGAEQIRARLRSRGHRFATLSDSEILVHLYEDSGVECLRHLRGEFAFALWDGRTSCLWAARDRFGIKPLFYSTVPDGIALASEAKSLFAMGVTAAWDADGVAEQLFFFTRQDRTLFRNVRQVPAGHYLLHASGETHVRRYWDLDYPERPDTGCPPATHAARFGDALRTAVHLRLRSDVPVTVYLSGGLDSSTVLALAAERAAERTSALHISFAGTDYDESALAAQAAAWTGARLEVVAIDERTLVDHFAPAVWHGETLAFNAHGVARYLQSRAARARGYTVALTGDGADESLGGYPGFRQDAEPHHLDASGGGRVLRDRLGYAPAWIARIQKERAPFHVLLAPEVTAAFDFDRCCEEFLGQFDVRGQLTGRHPLLQSMYLWSKSVLPNYTLCADRLDMAHGVESRQPFLDHELWEVTRELPPDLLIRGGEEKWILRRAAAGWVPPAIAARTKHSFTAPAVSARGPLRDFVNDELRSPSCASVPFIDRDAVVGLLDMLDTAAAPGFDSALMMLLSMHLLQKAYRLS